MFFICKWGYILEKLFSKIIIPEQVYSELMDNKTPPIVKTNFKKLKDGFVETKEIKIMSQEYTTFNLIKKGFWSQTGKCCGDDESAAMALAYLSNGIVASNNLSDIEEYIESLDIELITSSMILSKAFENDIVCEDTANELWKEMVKKGIDLPKNSFKEYYDELYESDCERFLKSE